MFMKKRSDGYYRKKIRIGGKDVYFYGTTVSDVNKKVLNFKKQCAAPAVQTKSISKWIDMWFEHHLRKGLSPNTIDSYRKPISDCKAYFEDKDIRSFHPIDVDDFIDYLVGLGYARQTINLRYIVMCKTFDFAAHNEAITTNPARLCELPKNLPQTKREPLTQAQIEKISSGHNLYAATLLFTGLRRNEALGLDWSAIDWVNKRIEVRQQLMWETGRSPYIEPKPKTKSGFRTVPMLEPLEKILLQYKKERGLIFCDSKGNPMSEGGFQRMWKSIKNELNIDVTPHQFRHAYITMMWAAGIDAKTAQILAGHAKSQTTLDIYTHLDKSASDKAGIILNAYLHPKN